MEDRVPYGYRPADSFIVYKFEVNPINPEISRVQSWKNFTSAAACKMIPANYKLFDAAAIKSKDYYLVVHLRSSEDNICYYYVKTDY